MYTCAWSFYVVRPVREHHRLLGELIMAIIRSESGSVTYTDEDTLTFRDRSAYRFMALEILHGPGFRMSGKVSLFQWARQTFNIRKRSKIAVYILFCGATRQFPDSRVIAHIIDNGSAAEYKLLMDVTGRRHTHSRDTLFPNA